MSNYCKPRAITTIWYWYKSRHIIMEENREFRNKPIRVFPINMQQSQENTMGNEQSLQ